MSIDVLDADGRRRDVQDGAIRPLGELLADEFLTCRIGKRGLTYDGVRKKFLLASPGGIRRLHYPARYHVVTTVEPESSPGAQRRRRAERKAQLDVVRALTSPQPPFYPDPTWVDPLVELEFAGRPRRK